MFKFFSRKKQLRDTKPTIVADNTHIVRAAVEEKNTKHLTLMQGLSLYK